VFGFSVLERVPQRLVVDGVVELHLGALDDGAQFARAAIGGSLFQIDITALDVAAQNPGDPLRRLEVGDGLLNIVRRETYAGAQLFQIRDLPVDARTGNREQGLEPLSLNSAHFAQNVFLDLHDRGCPLASGPAPMKS